MRLLHVVATDERRGAEVFASDLIRALDGAVCQRVAVLRGSSGTGTTFGAPTDVLGNGRYRGSALRSAMALAGAVRRWRPDAIQVHGGEALKRSVPVAARFGVPLVYRRIGSAHPRVARGPRRLAYGALMQRAARVIAVAEQVRCETVEVFGVAPGRVVTIPNAVDPERLQVHRDHAAARRGLGIPQGSSVVLVLGALTWEKDPQAHLAVVERVIRAHPDVVAVFAGDGPLRGQLEARIHAGGLSGRVLMLGSRGDVPDLLAAGDVLLVASRTEGAPASVIEAGITGLPVVAHAVGGVPELIVDGVTGLLCPRGDVRALATAVLRLLDDRDARRTMGAAARERCLDLYDIEAVAPRYLSVYQDVIAGRPGRLASLLVAGTPSDGKGGS